MWDLLTINLNKSKLITVKNCEYLLGFFKEKYACFCSDVSEERNVLI